MSTRDSSILTWIIIRFLAVLTIIITVCIGIALGLSLAETTNIRNRENFFEFAPALPTRILDINGTLITEFSADERRELISLSELPRHFIHAVLVREDPNFFHHRGFCVRAIARATWGQITGNFAGGGSTITQQIAGTLHTNRREMTVRRKIVELWYAIQMERRFTKNEILEIYLNQINTGPGVFGVEAASQFFFGHSVREITLAESALLVVLFSNPTRYNPINNPNAAMDRQLFVLNRMIEKGYTTREEAEASFNEYWDNFDFTRASIAAYFKRADAAPWFSEHVRRELEGLMWGTMDFHRDGFTVHTTLNMRHQEAAERFMAQGLERANREFRATSSARLGVAERAWRPIVELLSLTFDLDQIHATSGAQNQQRAVSRYTRIINPVVDMAAMVFGIPELKTITTAGFENLRTATERSVVEGALVTLENDTGFITALVGGSRFDDTNQFIRATQGNLQPGSAFKPLYYSAAIDSRAFTAATRISDKPVVFHNEDGTPYMPLNFMGRWHGSVLFFDALAQSMNVPSIRILDGIGFDAAIDRSAALLGYTDPDEIRRRFPRVFPLGLGVNTTSPLRMARAFAIFANQGREVTPIAIRSIEDRNGKVIIDLERELRQEQRRRGNAIQVVSPQNAYIMNTILKRTLERGPNGHGTLFHPTRWGAAFTFRDENGNTFRMPMAGKTGTPQNWSDAWVVGYSAYYTTAVWFGFDRPGNSLGVTLTGSTLAGPIWAEYMREIHLGLPLRNFVRPSTGIVTVSVCARSGLLRNPSCNHGEVTLSFLEGTQPRQLCDVHGNPRATETIRHIELNTRFIDTSNFLRDIQMPVLDESIFGPPRQTTPASGNASPSHTQISSSNPWLDDLPLITVDENIFLDDLNSIQETVVEQPAEEEEETAFHNPSPEDFLNELEPPLFNPFLD